MTTFALVHGAWHGAWCWDAVIPHLEAAGHRAIAVDLPCDDPTATFDEYADVVVDALAGQQDDLVLVGHSMAGYTIPLVAGRIEAQAMVWVCALVPAPGVSYQQQVGDEPDMMLPGYQPGLARDEQGLGRWVEEDVACRVLFQDCDEVAAHDAYTRLRPQATRLYAEPCSLEALPATPSTYVVCAEDHLVNPAWSRRTARDRLGAELVELPGGHSPFLSRPRELAEVLLRVAG